MSCAVSYMSQFILDFKEIAMHKIFMLLDINRFLLWQGNPILGVHMYLYSDDVSEVHCPQGSGNAPRQGALCHAVTDADGKFTFRSIPCGMFFQLLMIL